MRRERKSLTEGKRIMSKLIDECPPWFDESVLSTYVSTVSHGKTSVLTMSGLLNAVDILKKKSLWTY